MGRSSRVPGFVSCVRGTTAGTRSFSLREKISKFAKCSKRPGIVLKLRRIAIGFLRDGRLPVGQYRFLTKREVARFLRLGRSLHGEAEKTKVHKQRLAAS